MPAKPRRACNPRRARLAFLESPQQGPVHEYGPAPATAENPICVPTKPLDQNTSIAWVSPQFEQPIELRFPAQKRLRNSSVSAALQSRPGDASRLARKPGACKFPPLSFTQQTSPTILQTGSHCARRRPPPRLPKQTPVPGSPPPQESTLLPPDIQTPLQDRCLQPGTAEMPTPGDANTPLGNEPGEVLAEDTPEHDYGLRVTWRRRRELMKYLKSRGRLKSSACVL